MNRYFAAALLAGGMLLSSGQVRAQNYGPNGMYAPQSVSSTVDRVHQDLNHAYASWIVSGGDRHRLDHAERELRDFAQKWNRGRFDKGQLDGAIGSIQHVVDNNHMPQGERERLFGDLEQLRGMRQAYDRHEIGYR